MNWISRIFFWLNNILNWILGKAILNRILNESFFGKFQHWIESDRVSNTPNALRRHILSNSDETMIKIVVRQGCGSVLMEEACNHVRSKWSLVPVVHIGNEWNYAYWLESQILRGNNNLLKNMIKKAEKVKISINASIATSYLPQLSRILHQDTFFVCSDFLNKMKQLYGPDTHRFMDE